MNKQVINTDLPILLLSSTQDPYFRDIFDIMFYPSGIHYRFRYQTKWVSDEFKDMSGQLDDSKINFLNGRDAIIVLISTQKNDTFKLHEFLPVREAVITNARIVGDFLWIDFELGNWVTYVESASFSAPNEHHETIKGLMPEDSKTVVTRLLLQTKPFSLATVSDNAGLNDMDTLNNWTKITTHISNFHLNRADSKKIPVFLKFMKMVDTTKNKNMKVVDVGDQKGFEITSDHSYNLDIVEYTNQNVQPFDLELKTDEKLISQTAGISEIRGKYDLLHFNFLCASLSKSVITTFSFESSSKDYTIGKLFFWAKVKTKRWNYVIGPLLVLTISALFAGDEFVNFLTGQPFNGGTLVIGLVGSILSLVGTQYLRK